MTRLTAVPAAADLAAGARPAAADARDRRAGPVGGAARAGPADAGHAAQPAGARLAAPGAADRLPGAAEAGDGRRQDAGRHTAQ